MVSVLVSKHLTPHAPGEEPRVLPRTGAIATLAALMIAGLFTRPIAAVERMVVLEYFTSTT
jgi:hypothetical protein